MRVLKKIKRDINNTYFFYRVGFLKQYYNIIDTINKTLNVGHLLLSKNRNYLTVNPKSWISCLENLLKTTTLLKQI